MNKQTKALTLIDILKIQHQCDETGEMVAVSRQALDEAITKLEALEQPAQEPVAWISVKDRLPKEVGRYLVYVEEIYDLGNAHYIWNAGFNPNDGIFQEETMKGATVTHWMNLPNTPNGISHYINPTHPAPAWQSNKEFVLLSDDEVQEVFNLGHKTFKEFARAIEQALKEKNHEQTN